MVAMNMAQIMVMVSDKEEMRDTEILFTSVNICVSLCVSAFICVFIQEHVE